VVNLIIGRSTSEDNSTNGKIRKKQTLLRQGAVVDQKLRNLWNVVSSRKDGQRTRRGTKKKKIYTKNEGHS